MAATLFNLSDLNIAIVESSFTDSSRLRDYMNSRGKKPVSCPDAPVKPLLTRTFLDFFLPSEFSGQELWNYAYINHKGNSALLKLMNGSVDGLSSHRKTMQNLARRGYTVSDQSDVLLFRALRDKCSTFFKEYACAEVDAAETLSHWKTETTASGHIRLPDPIRQFLDHIEKTASEKDRQMEAFAGMFALALTAGIGSQDLPVIEEWDHAYLDWCRHDYPGYAISPLTESGSEGIRARFNTLRRQFGDNIDPVILPHFLEREFLGAGRAKTNALYSITELLDSTESILFLTGYSGTGKRSSLQYLFSLDDDPGRLPLYLKTVSSDGILHSVSRFLRPDEPLHSWRSVFSLLSGKILRVYLPDLFGQSSFEKIIAEVEEALDQTPEGSLQFFISSMVCPFELENHSVRILESLPLDEQQKQTYLRSAGVPEDALNELSKNRLFWSTMNSPLNLTFYALTYSRFHNAEIPFGMWQMREAAADPAAINDRSGYVFSSVGFSAMQAMVRQRSVLPITVSDLLYNYYLSILRPGEKNDVENAAVLYLSPLLAAYMTYAGITRIGLKSAQELFFDSSLYPVLHTDILAKYRYSFAAEDIPRAFRHLVNAGILIVFANTYSFSYNLLQDFSNALHSMNLFDIEIKENVFIPSSYPYNAHSDYFWQMLPTPKLQHYEQMLPRIRYAQDRFDVARLYCSWSCVIFYGNGTDEPGAVDNSLKGSERIQHMVDAMERSVEVLAPVVENTWFPCAYWDYSFFKKRIAELLLELDPAGNAAKAQLYYEQAFDAVLRMIRYSEKHSDKSDSPMADYEYVCKHIYDKYAQFLLQKCPPLHRSADGLWHYPGEEHAFSEEELKDKILYALNKAAEQDNEISLNRLGLIYAGRLGLWNTAPDHTAAYKMFLKSAFLGDWFARGMVCELMLDHPEELSSLLLPPHSAPAGITYRPRSVGEALRRGLLPDCCIAWLRSDFDADIYGSLISESRKSRYATAFHQLGRCYMMKGDLINARKFLESAASMDWSQNDNTGEYDRLMKDLETLRSQM